VKLGKKPANPTQTFRFIFTPTNIFETFLDDAHGDAEQTRNVPQGKDADPVRASLDVSFSDMKGQIWDTTKFDFTIRRDNGVFAGEYNVEVRDSDNNAIGKPFKVKLAGKNDVVDRRADRDGRHEQEEEEGAAEGGAEGQRRGDRCAGSCRGWRSEDGSRAREMLLRLRRRWRRRRADAGVRFRFQAGSRGTWWWWRCSGCSRSRRGGRGAGNYPGFARSRRRSVRMGIAATCGDELTICSEGIRSYSWPLPSTVPDDLLDRVDARAKALGVSRNRLILEALEASLGTKQEWAPELLTMLAKPLSPGASRELDAAIEAARSRRSPARRPPRL